MLLLDGFVVVAKHPDVPVGFALLSSLLKGVFVEEFEGEVDVLKGVVVSG